MQRLLVFMEQSDSERHQLYPVPNKDENRHKINELEVSHYQLNKALVIPSLRDTVKDKNCLHGVICVDETVQ